jgi:hypothetical protein
MTEVRGSGHKAAEIGPGMTLQDSLDKPSKHTESKGKANRFWYIENFKFNWVLIKGNQDKEIESKPRPEGETFLQKKILCI